MTMSMRALARVLALAALLTLAAMAPASAISAKTFEKQVIAATNAYRANHGAAAVKLQTCVDTWANGQAKWMAQHKKLQHRDGRLSKIIKDCKLMRASENIGWNFSSGNKVVKAWSGSKSHADNMRAPKMRYIGVGVSRARNGDVYVAQVFGARK